MRTALGGQLDGMLTEYKSKPTPLIDRIPFQYSPICSLHVDRHFFSSASPA